MQMVVEWKHRAVISAELCHRCSVMPTRLLSGFALLGDSNPLLVNATWTLVFYNTSDGFPLNQTKLNISSMLVLNRAVSHLPLATRSVS